MKKKIIAMLILIALIIVISVIISIVNTSKVANEMAIQEQVFEAAEGYNQVNKTLTLTNDSNNFMINGDVVTDEMRVEPQTSLAVEVINDSQFPTSIHFHGVNGNSNMDGVGGVSQDNIDPGESFTYKFNLDQPGTYMYHAHVDSTNQVNNENLYGGLVVEEESQVNSDMLIFNTNINDVEEHHTANQTFDQVLVNGRANGSMQVDNDQNIYLNIANLSSTPLSINFGQDIKYRITSIDANPASSVWLSNSSVTVPTGQRFIVEIENPLHSFQISTSLKSKHNATYDVFYKQDKTLNEQDFSDYVSNSMMTNTEFDNLDSNSQLIYDVVETDNDLDVMDKHADVEVNMELGMSGGYWVINDKAFPDTQSLDVKAGDVVEVTLSNTSHMAETHPFHLHGHKFQVVALNGQELEKNLVLDTIDVEPGNQVTIRFIADNPGIWAFHCHNLVHAGKGMLTTLNYEGYSTEVTDQVGE